MGAKPFLVPKMDREEVHRIALSIRNIVKATGEYRHDMALACTLMSVLVADALAHVHREPTTIVYGDFEDPPEYHEPHVWLTWNGNILDATATQFDQLDLEFPEEIDFYQVFAEIEEVDSSTIDSFSDLPDEV